MKITFAKTKLTNLEDVALILPIYEDEKFSRELQEIDKKLDNFISNIIADGFYHAELGHVHVIYPQGKLKIKKIILVGLGTKKDFTHEKYQKAISAAINYMDKTKVDSCSVHLIHDLSLNELQNMAEIAYLSLYKFQNYKSKKRDLELKKLNFIIEKEYSKSELEQISKIAVINTEAIFKARDLANEPSNIITPSELAKDAKLLESDDIKVEVLGEDEMQKLGMNLILSVSKGSDEEAQLISLDYKPKKYDKTVVLVGKGLTFDSGGISIKPAQGMEEMKMDMSGAAAVIGTFHAIGKIKPENVRIVGVIPATENLLSGKSQKPGDIWKSYSGKTVKVLNTDAEGRLVLADAMSWAQEKYKPDYMIDIATLTGACLVALGYEYTGLFGNNQSMINDLAKNSQDSYEKLWPMPLCEEFMEATVGEVADLKNLGYGHGEAGACTAAAFLAHFVDPKIKWAHLDIAGPAMVANPKPYQKKGGTGAGVKTLLEFINKLKVEN